MPFFSLPPQVRRRFRKALPREIYKIKRGPRKIEDFMGKGKGFFAKVKEIFNKDK